MARYLLKRLAQVIPTLLGASIVVFLIMRLAPGDPARLMAGPDATMEDILLARQRLGLDKPLVAQYVSWVGGLLVGDWGRSTRTGNPVLQELLDRLPATFQLALAGTVVATVVGLATGVVAAVRRGSLLDASATAAALVGVSMPPFWLALLLIWVFAVSLQWFPTSGRGTWLHLVLPALALGSQAAAIVARVTRSSLLEVLRQDYIRTARAKGVNEVSLIGRHALRNALIPVVTVVGLQFGYLLAGAVVTETVFAYPGIGWLLVSAVSFRDFPLVQGALLMLALQFALVNLMVDLLYAYVDPRIRYG